MGKNSRESGLNVARTLLHGQSMILATGSFNPYGARHHVEARAFMCEV